VVGRGQNGAMVCGQKRRSAAERKQTTVENCGGYWGSVGTGVREQVKWKTRVSAEWDAKNAIFL